ncbi:MAG: OmpA family protein, partial [Arenimonas sp.]
SPLEVIRNYQDEIVAGGGKVLYTCKNSECGGDMQGNDHGGGTQGLLEQLYPHDRLKAAAFSNANCASTRDIKEQRYMVAALPADASQATLAVMTYTVGDDLYCKAFNDRTVTMVIVIEPKAREKKMVTVTASEMAKSIASTGKIALYGIYFDTNKSVVKAESKPTLDQIAALLKDQPTLKLGVVGYTDNVGGAAPNLSLSKRRADAVANALIEDYGVDAARLVPSGAGMGSPLATNDNEEGRAKNRRVELVKK